jgi:hypothetical protein
MKMGEVLAASTDFGLDEERVRGVMNASKVKFTGLTQNSQVDPGV